MPRSQVAPARASARARAPAQRQRADADRRARDRLIERHLPLARRLAVRYAGSAEPLEDLVQVASVGLIKAVERFEPERGVRFSTFAVPTILGELRRHFRDAGWAVHVERGAKERAHQLARAQRELSARHGRSPTLSELAQLLECSVQDVLDALQAAAAHTAVSLDAPTADGEPDAPLDRLRDPDRTMERIDETLALIDATRHLPRRQRAILFMRFAQDLPQSEIAARLGISQMHVSRLLRDALARLRELTA
jgi:RNA polymerase sigma-B factor